MDTVHSTLGQAKKKKKKRASFIRLFFHRKPILRASHGPPSKTLFGFLPQLLKILCALKLCEPSQGLILGAHEKYDCQSQTAHRVFLLGLYGTYSKSLNHPTMYTVHCVSLLSHKCIFFFCSIHLFSNGLSLSSHINSKLDNNLTIQPLCQLFILYRYNIVIVNIVYYRQMI